MNRDARSRQAHRLALLPHFLAALLALPVAVGLLGTLLPAFGYLPALGGTHAALDPFRALLAEPGLTRSCLLSLGTGLFATLLSVLAAGAFLAAAGPRRLAAARGALPPFLAVPHAAAAFGLAFLLAPSGLAFRLLAAPLGLDAPPDLLLVGDRSGTGMVLGLAIKEVPFLLLVALAALPRVEAARRLAFARALGYGQLAAFLHAVWPALYRQIRLPVLAVAAFSSSVVDVALILGPSTPAPLAVRVLGWMGDPDLVRRFEGSAGAVLQLALTGAALLAWIALEHLAGAARRRLAASGRRFATDAPARRLLALPALFMAAMLGLGLLVLAAWSFARSWPFPDVAPSSLTGANWTRGLARLGAPLANTLLLALLSALAALAFAILILEALRRGRPSDQALPRSLALLLYLPLLVPSVSFLFGIDVALLFLGATPGLFLLAAVHLVFVAPYVVLALFDPWMALDPRFERTAAALGRGPLARFLRVRLPLLLAPILSALAIGFAVSVGQYLPTLVIGAGRLPTVTTEAVALASGGDRRLVAVAAFLQGLLPLLAFALALGAPALRGRLPLARSGP